ncbi:MAG: conjugal transfer protein TraB [Euryarchaeota archaeon]|nr:conjugal transfer protein TraB [Euryarchaeota archaeon]
MIIIVGVAHVIDLKMQIERLIVHEDPAVVAVELDYGRYLALKHGTTGKMPYLYRKMGEMQKSIAEMLGTEVGKEMLTAVEVAQLFGKEVAFIDMDAVEIAQRIKKEMTVREKAKLYGSFILAPFSRKKLKKEDVEELLQNEDKYIKYVKEKFPGLSKALFDDREAFMAENIKKLEEKGKVIVFVGDGHLPGLKKRIPEAKAIKLKELMGDSHSVSYTITLN